MMGANAASMLRHREMALEAIDTVSQPSAAHFDRPDCMFGTALSICDPSFIRRPANARMLRHCGGAVSRALTESGRPGEFPKLQTSLPRTCVEHPCEYLRTCLGRQVSLVSAAIREVVKVVACLRRLE